MKRVITYVDLEDEFLDSIYSSKMPRGKLKLKIKNHTRPVIITLAQLYIYHRDTDNYHHWSNEVISQFPEIDRLDGKGRGKLPSKKFILDNSWGEYKDSIKKLMSMAVIHEGQNQFYDSDRAKNVDEFSKIVEEYLDFLATSLSQSDVLDPEEAIIKLKDLNLIY